MSMLRGRLAAHGLEEAKADLGDLIDAVVRELGMPRSLKQVGVGREKFEDLAVNALEDVCRQADLGKIERRERVLKILEMCT